jgi:hypothetical protein
MANTYQRIRQVLLHLEAHPADSQLSAAAGAIRERRLPEFRLRGDGSIIEDFMSEASISRLVLLMVDLGLIGLKGGQLRFRPTDFGYLHNDEAYARKIDQAAKNFMSRNGVPLEKVSEAIGKIALPRVPDAPTVYEELGDEVDSLTKEMFAKILFLLACSRMSVGRAVHIHYSAG